MKINGISKKALFSWGALFLYIILFVVVLLQLYEFYCQTPITLDFLKYYQFTTETYITYCVIILIGVLFSIGGYYILKKIKQFKPKFNLLFFLIFIFFYSVVNSVILSHALENKEVIKRYNIVKSILKNRDEVAEKQALTTLSLMEKDSLLLSKVAQIPHFNRLSYEDSLIAYIQSTYFEKGWSAYYLQFTFCSPHLTLLVGENEQKVYCDNYFHQKISYAGQVITEKKLFRMNYGLDYFSYLLTSSFCHCEKDSMHLYIEMVAPAIYSEMGYFDLNYRGVLLGNDYSYAIYNKADLLSHGGYFIYPMISEQSDIKRGKNNYFYGEGFNHLVKEFDDGRYLVVSKQEYSFFYHLQLFSFFFFLFFLFAILLFGLYKLVFRSQQTSFAYRLQFVMLSVLLGSLVSIGVASLWYLQEFNKNKNERILKEKTLSVIQNMESRYLDKDLDASSLLTYMQRLTFILDSDINIYDTNGRLWISTEPNLFNEEHQTHIINSIAFSVLKEKKSNLYLHYEKVKDQSYLSSYSPFRNSKNEVIAYVNLPYFSIQAQWKDEIAYYVLVYLNICLVLMLVSVIIAIMLSNKVIKPLKLLGEYVSDIELGKKNLKIKWNSKDEVGELIYKYNALLDELDKSAQLLASSERQHAWTEMASQVAHEIKNPLTPIKLQAQLLQRMYQAKSEGFELKLNKFVIVLEEQINLLSTIATNFANFAQITTVNYSKQNAMVSLLKAAELFSSNLDYNLEINNQLSCDVFVNTDETQLIQVWTNLIKNAVQSLIISQKKGMIEIVVTQENNILEIAVKDNGIGIAPSELSKIFEPHFTTKTSGTGLGLSICKRIIENMQGTISVKSTLNQGSVFYVRLPIVVEDDLS